MRAIGLACLFRIKPFDTWKADKVKFDFNGLDFDQWWKVDMSSMVLRDQNHPSIVVIPGIGNEIPELEVEQGRMMGKHLAEQMRSLDTDTTAHAGISGHYYSTGRRSRLFAS